MQKLHKVRDRVLDGAGIAPGDVVLDVGCGDGLIGFGAMERIGTKGTVIFSDISAQLVDRCKGTAEELGVLDRSRFVVASATNLEEIATGSVDALTARSVLIYVDEKALAFAEFFRVLRPAGRISIGEPINQFTHPEPTGTFLGYDVSAVKDLADKLEAFFDREERPKITAMMDFNERDLMTLAEHTGFRDISLDFEAHVKPVEPEAWARFLRTAGNPLSPTLEEAMTAALTPAERNRFSAHLKPLVESGGGTERRAFAFVTARKPAA
ncbi:MAG TPA: class I SAM-dependent methyltransferase [Candidatus Angelobacter sp.]|nr:class I SAM-dependent methyltransferase [Candidatus Angelobacter sp.]